jgi:hypothetical protein
LQQLLATNGQVKEEQANRQQQMSTAKQIHQTTLTQCFGSASPPADPPPAAKAFASGYRCIAIVGQQYLLNKTTNHLLVVPQTKKCCVGESEKDEPPQPC